MKKKILIVNTVEYVMGGISSVITNYYEKIKKDDLQIDFIVNKTIEKRYLNIIKQNDSNIYILDRNRNPFNYMLQLYHIIKKNGYDVIHVHGNSATMLVDLFPAVIGKVKIRIAHSHNTQCSHPIIHMIMAPAFKLSYTQALACSKEAGEWIFGKNKFEILENGINLEQYKFSEIIRKEVRQQLGLTGKFVIGHIGLINEQKNHKMLLKIVYQMRMKIPNLFLLCVTGSESIPEDIEQLIKKYRLEEVVLFLFKRTDVYRLLQAMDIFVFPSKWEGFPDTLVEAQASGLECIVSDNVTSKVNLTHSINFQSNSDITGWIECIERVYDANDMDRAANSIMWQKKIRCEGFDLKQSVDKLYSWYTK